MKHMGNGHSIYTKDDFTPEEIARKNILAVMVIEKGVKFCPLCGGEGEALDKISCADLYKKLRHGNDPRWFVEPAGCGKDHQAPST